MVSIDLAAGDSLALSFDHQNHRLVSISSMPFAASSTTTFYSDFHIISGVSLPFHRATKSTAFGSFELDGDVRSASVDPGIVSKLAFQNRTPDDSLIDGGKTSVSLPFESSNGLIYLKVKLNGRGPYRFLLDSGRANHVSAQVAARLHLTNGFGKEIVDDKNSKSLGSRVATFAVGAATVRNQPIIVDPAAYVYYYSAIDGDNVDGVLGFEFLRRFVTTLDFGTKTMTLTTPASFTPHRYAHAVPFVFDGLIPRIAASVDGKAGDFAVNGERRLDRAQRARAVRAKPPMARERVLFRASLGRACGFCKPRRRHHRRWPYRSQTGHHQYRATHELGIV